MVVMDKVISELSVRTDNKKILDSIAGFPVVSMPELDPKQVDDLTTIWRSAGVKKDEDDFRNPKKADIHLLTWAWNMAMKEEDVTIVTKDPDISRVAPMITRFYGHKPIRVKGYSDLSVHVI
jgi:hypothetical protein